VIAPLCGPAESLEASMLIDNIEGVVPLDGVTFIQEGSEGVALKERSVALSLLFTTLMA
jgi:hypothetical protein